MPNTAPAITDAATLALASKVYYAYHASKKKKKKKKSKIN
jgi:hypothetical protein